MAFRVETEPNKKRTIIIDGFDKGIAPDPYSGTNRMLSVDLETPGEVAVGYPITTSTLSGGGASLGKPIARSTRYFGYGTPGVPVSGAAQSYAILDENGRVWESNSITGTWTYLANGATESGASNQDGLCYWLGYLFKTRGANIDYWNGTVWSNNWQMTLTSSTKHFMYAATNNVLYITNGNYLASVTAPTPSAFVPGTSATFSFSTTKLQLPVNEICVSLAEVGSGNAPQSTLLIGGSQNAIYPWDKIATSFALPIYVADNYIKNMISVNQNVFIFAGNTSGRGRIFITNGSQADLYYKIPDYIFGEQDPYYQWGDAIFHRNNLVFGFFVAKNDGTGVILSSQVWAIRLDQSKTFRGISELPVATAKGSATVLIPNTSNTASPGFDYIVGWDDNGSTPGIGYSGTVAGVNSLGFSIRTDLIPIGTFINKFTGSEVEYKLRTPLEAGESITITPVVDNVSQSPLTFDPTPTTGVFSGYAKVNFQNNQWIQFIVAGIGNSATSGVRLHEIRIRE